MPILGQLLILTAVPAVLAWTLLQIFRRFLPRGLTERYATGMAFGFAFFIGFQMAEGFGTWIPQRHWHWLLWLVPAAAIVGGLRRVSGFHFLERGVLLAGTAVTSGWLLVPNWPDLRPSQSFWRIFLGFSFFLQTAILEHVVWEVISDEGAGLKGLRPNAESPRGTSITLASEPTARISAILVGMIVSAMVVTGIVAVFVSVSYSRIALVGSTSLIGCWAGSFRSRQGIDLRQLILPFSIAVGGMAFVGCVEPREMVWGLLIAPWAPLAIGLVHFARGSNRRIHWGRRLAVAGVGFVLGTAIAISVWNMRPVPAAVIPESAPIEEDFPF
jgi:hypothetical protein